MNNTAEGRKVQQQTLQRIFKFIEFSHRKLIVKNPAQWSQGKKIPFGKKKLLKYSSILHSERKNGDGTKYSEEDTDNLSGLMYIEERLNEGPRLQ